MAFENDEQRIQAYETWLANNKDKAGTPEYVKVTGVLNQIKPPVDESEPNPYGVYSTIGRIGTSAAAGVVDLAGAAVNKVADLQDAAAKTGVGQFLGFQDTGGQRIPSLAAGIRSKIGVEELPEDAPTGRKVLETLGTAAVGGAAGAAARAGTGAERLAAAQQFISSPIRNVALPTAGAYGGAAAGGAVGEAVGGETGRGVGELIGGVGGGMAPAAATPLAGRIAQQYYGNKYAAPNAAEMAAAARAENTPTTFGMLANPQGKILERSYIDTPAVTGQRGEAMAGIRGAAERMVEARGALPAPTPATADYVAAAQNAQPGARGAAAEQLLLDRIGANAPTNVLPVYRTWANQLGTDATAAETVTPRLTPLFRTIPTDAQGRQVVTFPPAPTSPVPNLPPPAYGPPSPVPVVRDLFNRAEMPTAYSQVAGARSRLGQDLPNAPRLVGKVKDEIYGAMSDSMRQAAERRGVPAEAFDTAHAIYRNEARAGKLGDLVRSTIAEDKAPAFRQFADKVEAMDARTRDRLSGAAPARGPQNDVSAQLERTRLLSRGIDYPTSQGGLQRSMASVIAQRAPRIVRPLVKMAQNAKGALLESDVVRRGMAGERQSVRPRMTRDELAAALLAAQNATRVNNDD